MITKQDIEYLIQIHGEPDYVGMIDLAHFLKRPSKKEYPTYLNILLNTVLTRHQAKISLEVDGLGRIAYICLPKKLLKEIRK